MNGVFYPTPSLFEHIRNHPVLMRTIKEQYQNLLETVPAHQVPDVLAEQVQEFLVSEMPDTPPNRLLKQVLQDLFITVNWSSLFMRLLAEEEKGSSHTTGRKTTISSGE